VTRTVAVTGSEGFIGRRVVSELLRDPEVTVVRVVRPGTEVWPIERCRVIAIDMSDPSAVVPAELGSVDALVHLAWSALADFRSHHHLEQVDQHLDFLSKAVELGVQRVLCAGTCLEYGLSEGELSESAPAQPVVAYAQAKLELSKRLGEVVERAGASLVWGRVFYPYGEGQHDRSLWTALQKAMARGDLTFPMSPGLQVRDYLPVESVGSIFAHLALGGFEGGTLNVCSGHPVVLRDLVEQWARDRGSSIRLDLGAFGYPDYEPMAFWGSRKKLDLALAATISNPGDTPGRRIIQREGA